MRHSTQLARRSARRHDLDWLRVCAFAILILYHLGMFYVTWGWHVKSVHAGEGAEWLMRLVNPWRLPLLFFISGVALRFVADAAPLAILAQRRLLRLGVPILFGMAVVVAPQAYLELRASGEFTGTFLEFFPHYLDPGSAFSIITPTWNHLWYVVYILVYTLLLIPLVRPLARFMEGRGARLTGALFRGPIGIFVALALFAAPHVAIELLLAERFPVTHNLVVDWATHAHCLTVFILGAALAKDRAFWGAVDRSMATLVAIAIAFTVALAFLWLNWSEVRAVVMVSPPLIASVESVRIVAAWVTIFALFALAQRYLNRPSRVLAYATEAVFPWYILHQTILIIAGVWLTSLGLPVMAEAALLLIFVIAGCALCHELVIRRVGILRPLFGLKPQGSAPLAGTLPARSNQ